MRRTCVKCSASFAVEDQDLAFYDKVSPVFHGKKEAIPPPLHCPECRLQRRLAFRTQIYIFNRESSISGKKLFSRWPSDTTFPVYENAYWHDGDWDPLAYGRDVDFSRPFIDQIRELYAVTPKAAQALVPEIINSDYCNNATSLKNCYLVFGATETEDCMCSELCWYCTDCYECTVIFHSELCYDCTLCYRCYDVQSSYACHDCKGSRFLMNCRSCEHCFGCVNLRHAKYRMFNEQLTKEEYEKRMSELDLSSFSKRTAVAKRCRDFFLTHPRPHASNTQAEDVSGDFINESKSVHDSFFIEGGENVRYGYYLYGRPKDSYDHSLYGHGVELTYETSIGGGNAVRLLFCMGCFNNVSDLTYCLDSHNSSDCFGCSSLRRQKYCILNKQYTKDEYEKLVPEIIEHMRKTGEWGEFFPMSLAGIPYNKSLAYRYFPLSESEAKSQGLAWHERDALSESSALQSASVPDTPYGAGPLTATGAVSGKLFRISSQEIDKCIRLGVPLPRSTYDERMEQRAALLGGIRLYDRTCAKSGKAIRTTVPPDSPWIVWDKDVYEQEFSS